MKTNHSHSGCRRVLALLLTVLTVMSMLPNAAFAAQPTTYRDPAEHWMNAGSRTNELDINAVVSHETFYCFSCKQYTSFTIWRTPEYTRDGQTALTRNVLYSDGTMVDGESTGSILDGDPGIDAFYTGYHWTKSMCDNCGVINANGGATHYDGLHQSALCRARADWLVGINATRYFSLLYGRTLNIGRVMSPTLALLVQREAEIAAFVPEPFYTVQLDCGFTAATERMKDRKEADAVLIACDNKATVQTVERKEKTEKPPALYDLTSLQRDANRILGYTAQQTLDYLQALYEKKLSTYPRTDSRYFTDDMEASVPGYVVAAAAILNTDAPTTILAAQVCNSKKVSDHHAVIPTLSAGSADLDALPLGEREILKLAARGLLRAVSEAHRYAETTVTLDCGSHSFTVKGKTVITPGWRAYDSEKKDKENALPE